MFKSLLNQPPKIISAALACLTLAICTLLVSPTDNPVQHWLGDLAQRHASVGLDKSQVIVVAIDDESLSKLGPWPWSNRIHARLIDQLRSLETGAIAFTTPVTAQIDNETGQASDAEGDHLLAQAMRSQGQVVLPIAVSTRSGTAPDRSLVSALSRSERHFSSEAADQSVPVKALATVSPELLGAAAGLGQTLTPFDSDGVVRREYATVKLGTQAIPSLSLALANLMSEQKISLVVTAEQLQLTPTSEAIRLGKDLSFPVRHGNTQAISIPYWQVLEGQVDRQLFKHKAVLIGATEGAEADRIQTPTGPLPRVMAVAASTHAVLDNQTYRHPAWMTLLELLLSASVVLLAATAFVKLTLRQNLLIIGALITLVMLASFLLMNLSTLTLQAVPQLTAMVTCFALTFAMKHHGTSNKAKAHSPAISMDTLKTLALTLHGQGQLDLAYQTLCRCPPNHDTLDLLYRLAADFERRRELLKAAQAYRHVGEIDQGYKDATQKARQLQQELERPKPVETPALKPRSNPETPKPAPQQDIEPSLANGQQSLGRYVIERQIGKGAMGVVYLGRDPKINRVVAIKAIPLADEFEDQDLVEARERFFREAEMAGRLNHPGIVTIFDAGEDHGLAYIAMEYIRGEHISYYCEPHRLLPVRKTLTMIIRVAEALNYAHLQNVVHRDIKPANIMFNIETDALKITDFGIARLSDVSRTRTGIVLGTPSFMSPEQLEGRPLDGRSDLFSLGITMYQMLTGQLPFRADSMTRLMNKIATEPHTPLRSLRPDLPECLDPIIDRCLAKSADDRYQTGIDMADAIRNCLRGLN